MNTFTQTLNTSCQQYQRLYDEIVAAVELAQNNKYEEAAIAINQVENLLAEIKQTDNELFPLISEDNVLCNINAWNKRTQQIQITLDFHHKSMPHLMAVMAMKKQEMNTIKKGIRGMNGYYTGNGSKGTLIKSSL